MNDEIVGLAPTKRHIGALEEDDRNLRRRITELETENEQLSRRIAELEGENAELREGWILNTKPVIVPAGTPIDHDDLSFTGYY